LNVCGASAAQSRGGSAIAPATLAAPTMKARLLTGNPCSCHPQSVLDIFCLPARPLSATFA
jgi:hypothetical protein